MTSDDIKRAQELTVKLRSRAWEDRQHSQYRDRAAATIDALLAERERLIDVLYSNGFVRCDISACNCGSWHARYGLRERFEEIKDALSEATDLNGKTVLSALNEVINERDALRADAERYRWLRDNPWPHELEFVIEAHQNARWDAAIDAARKSG